MSILRIRLPRVDTCRPQELENHASKDGVHSFCFTLETFYSLVNKLPYLFLIYIGFEDFKAWKRVIFERRIL